MKMREIVVRVPVLALEGLPPTRSWPFWDGQASTLWYSPNISKVWVLEANTWHYPSSPAYFLFKPQTKFINVGYIEDVQLYRSTNHASDIFWDYILKDSFFSVCIMTVVGGLFKIWKLLRTFTTKIHTALFADCKSSTYCIQEKLVKSVFYCAMGVSTEDADRLESANHTECISELITVVNVRSNFF